MMAVGLQGSSMYLTVAAESLILIVSVLGVDAIRYSFSNCGVLPDEVFRFIGGHGANYGGRDNCIHKGVGYCSTVAETRNLRNGRATLFWLFGDWFKEVTCKVWERSQLD